MRVLVADDQKSVGTSLAELVGQCQHEVVQVVGTGLEAIQAYARHQPDVVVMDYRMPKLNGATACRYILANDPQARIIIISGWASEHLLGTGALSILQKPATLEQLQQALDIAADRLTADRSRLATRISPDSNLTSTPPIDAEHSVGLSREDP